MTVIEYTDVELGHRESDLTEKLGMTFDEASAKSENAELTFDQWKILSRISVIRDLRSMRVAY